MSAPINLDAAERMLEEWRDADDQRRFATANWQLIRSNYAALLDAAHDARKRAEWEAESFECPNCLMELTTPAPDPKETP